jgi:acetyl esterase/lipase
MKTLLAFIAAVTLFVSCQKDTADSPAALQAEIRLNVAYGPDPLQKMDIFLPAGRNSAATKVIIMIHGGGWTQGDKNEFTPYIDTLKRRLPGYAIFNINYRLATGSANFFPTQENDVKAAIEYIYNNRDDYKISDKYVLLGASAGGHLALLQANKYTAPVKIKAVVDFFGPTELVSLYNNPPNPLIPQLLIQVTGGNPTTHATLYQQSSPLNFITAQSPPTILLHGGADIVVPSSQSVLLKNQLLSMGVAHEYVFYPAENHGWTGPSLADSFEKIQAFIMANVN